MDSPSKFWPCDPNVTAEIRVIRSGNMFLIFCYSVFVSPCDCSLISLFLDDRSGTQCCLLLLWSSASRYAPLHPLLLTHCYLSWLPMSSMQSDYFPLISDINKRFSPRELILTGCFLYVGPSCINPRDGCVWSAVCEIWHQQPESLKLCFFSLLILNLNFIIIIVT